MKVIVVGGGIAGLSATKTLLEKGHDVLLLEAQDQLGGRIKSVASGERWYDLGASWFHDTGNNVLYDVAVSQKWPVKLETDQIKMFVVKEDGTSYEEMADSEQTLLCCNDIPADLRSDDASVFDMSLHDFALRKFSEREALPIKAYEHFVGLNWNEISAVETPPFLHDHGTDAFQLGGNRHVIDWLLQQCLHLNTVGQLEIRTNSPVDSIEYTEDEIIVKTSNFCTYHCNKVIMTASLGYLRKHHGQIFKGRPLPSTLESAMANGVMSFLGKAVLEFPYRFWRDDWSRAHVFDKDSSMFVSRVYDSEDGPPALMIITGPPLSQLLERKKHDVWELLKPLLLALIPNGSNEVPDPSQMWISDWSLNPWTEGSYSALKVGQNMRDLILPMMQGAWDEKLLFAGEHTTIHGVGCMDGAYVSGVRAANQV